MTEPAPGSGSDPAMMLTRAEKKGDRWVVHGDNGSSPAPASPTISS